VLSAMERRSGGQGLVQFMRDSNSEDAVAVKFFFKKAAFDSEVCFISPVYEFYNMMPLLTDFLTHSRFFICGIIVILEFYFLKPFVNNFFCDIKHWLG
jgi:hypothetical protein